MRPIRSVTKVHAKRNLTKKDSTYGAYTRVLFNDPVKCLSFTTGHQRDHKAHKRGA